MPNSKSIRMEEIFNKLMEEGYENVMPQITSLLLNGVMELEREKYLKAGAYVRNPERISYANGYKDKKLGMRMGEVQLKIPQTRDCMFYPRTVEKGVRSEKALRLALSEMYIQGVSTRKVMKITEQLCGFEVSSTQVSRLTSEMDAEIDRWRNRPLEAFKYLMLDARYEKVRDNGRVVDMAILWAIGIDCSGTRSVLGISVSLSEAEIHWRTFLQGLITRGLRGVEYIVSDDHSGLSAARKALFSGVPWQRCEFHLAQNAQNYVSKTMNKSLIGEQIRDVFNAPNREVAQSMLKDFVISYEKTEPRLAKWAEENIPEAFTVFSLPVKIRKHLRTSNLCERINREIARRTRVIRIFPNEASCLRIVSAILMEVDEEWISGKKFFIEN